jgi:hypothetical protein
MAPPLLPGRSATRSGSAGQAVQRLDAALGRAEQAERRLADKDATITGLVAEKQVLKQEVETLTELVRARRSWWQRVFG